MTPYYQPYWLNDDELEHFGILGMKWGVRRYQNKDGTLTEAGKKRRVKSGLALYEYPDGTLTAASRRRARQYEKLVTSYEKKSQKLNAKSEGKSGIRAFIKQQKAGDYGNQAYYIRQALPKDPKSYAKTPEEEAQSAKIKKAAKVGAAVAAAGAVSVAAIMAGNSRAAAGAVSLGTKTISQLLSSGMLSKKQAATLVSENLKQNGSRSLGLSLWDKTGNPYYNPGMSDKEREMMATVMQYYLNQKR